MNAKLEVHDVKLSIFTLPTHITSNLGCLFLMKLGTKKHWILRTNKTYFLTRYSHGIPSDSVPSAASIDFIIFNFLLIDLTQVTDPQQIYLKL